MSWSFKIAFFVDAVTALFAIWTVLSDYFRHPDHPTYGKLALLTVGFCAWIGLSFFLYRTGHETAATRMVWLPAIPILGYAFFVLLFIILKPDMK